MISGTWQQVVAAIDDLLNDEHERFAFARKTLEGIRSTITAEEHATLGQRNSVWNIRRAGERGRQAEETMTPGERRGGSRRYDDFDSDRRDR